MDKQRAHYVDDDGPIGGQIGTHPAFCRVVVTQSSSGGPGGGMHLYGSDVQHPRAIRLEFEECEERRDHHKTWSYGRRTVLDVWLSESQWSRMVASAGNGSGTECTIRRGPNAEAVVEDKPGIEADGTADKLHGEIARETRKRMAAVTDATAKLSALVAANAGRKDVKEAMAHLDAMVRNFPLNVAYGEKTLHESMDRLVNEAKTEIKAYASHVIHRAGLEAIAGGFVPTLIDDKPSSSGDVIDAEA